MAAELEDCRHCGTPTAQRADGIPYCSMDCIATRRREKKMETIECPYPGCRWTAEYLPGNGLMKGAAYRKADKHRYVHRRSRGLIKVADVGGESDG